MLKNLKSFNLSQIELKVLDFWKKNQIFEKSLAQRKGKKRFVFYEGPPTANAPPAIHHVLARAFKDVIPRYKTMRGYYVPRQAGWDTHGLPVELQVEKALGFKSKRDIEKFGIAAFNRKCKESVWGFKEEWERFTERVGFWVDMKNPYITYEPKYIESLWWIIQRFFKKSFMYKGYKVAPWCPRCGTTLSSHELAQGYREVSDDSIYVKFKLIKGQEIANVAVNDKTYILSWTTTPWTL
ncbi:MAG: class I tRNA ligase family protein, partial [Candidatus Colwellbacteria bacterium]|nr:class I tRNA ligase family protein [Candidatus Colwellbacteria bacterium]